MSLERRKLPPLAFTAKVSEALDSTRMDFPKQVIFQNLRPETYTRGRQ
jgi:hypothetical protein